MAPPQPRRRRRGVHVVAEHNSPLGAWTVVRTPPHPWLEGAHGYHHAVATPATHRTSPAATVAVVVQLAAPSRVRTLDGRPVTRATAHLVGPSSRGSLVDAERFHGVQLELRPSVARRALGVPVAAIVDQVLELDTVCGQHARRLVEQLREAVDDRSGASGPRGEHAALARALATAMSWLEARARSADDHGTAPHEQHLEAAWAAATASRGTAGVDELANAAGVSTRHLGHLAAEGWGLGPKQVLNALRARHAARLITTTDVPLATVATAAGYADQSHLTRSMRATHHATPGQIRSESLPDGGGMFAPREGVPG